MTAEQRNLSCIFVVDDEPAHLRLLGQILASGGYDGQVLIEDPRQVIEMYEVHHPDLIMLDVNMPHLGGFSVLLKLQELDDPLLSPVLLMTAEPDRHFLERAHEAGARDFIAKPFNRVELLMRVRNLLEIQQARRSLHNQVTGSA